MNVFIEGIFRFGFKTGKVWGVTISQIGINFFLNNLVIQENVLEDGKVRVDSQFERFYQVETNDKIFFAKRLTGRL